MAGPSGFALPDGRKEQKEKPLSYGILQIRGTAKSIVKSIMYERRRQQLWNQLRKKKSQLNHFLSEVRIQGLRGIDDIRVVFDYPVSVIAGGNATGKSTVLFSAACAYKVPGSRVRDFVPSSLFPNYSPKLGDRKDNLGEIDIAFEYSTPAGRTSMRWRLGKSWSRGFNGRKGATQPLRDVYLRTLSSMSNPAEVRGCSFYETFERYPRRDILDCRADYPSPANTPLQVFVGCKLV